MSGVAPKKALGQHFLVDRNVLGVIAARGPHVRRRRARGGPWAVLTTYLADRVRHVHAIEVDRSLEPALAEALEGRPHVQLVFADALSIDPGRLVPPPTKLVANLPYNIATPPWPRLAGGTHAHGLVRDGAARGGRPVLRRARRRPTQVLVRLHARRTGFHAVSRTVFRPPPNVDSALVAFDRIPPPANADRVRRVVSGAFGHRRKTPRTRSHSPESPRESAVACSSRSAAGPTHGPRRRARRVRAAGRGARHVSEWREGRRPRSSTSRWSC